MDKETIYYGELVPLTGYDCGHIPVFVILQKDTKDDSLPPGTAEETITALKKKLSLAPGCLKSRRLIKEDDVVVLMAQVCVADDSCRKMLVGYLNGAVMRHVDHAVVSGFGLEEMLIQNGIQTKQQKEQGGDQ